MSDTVRIYKNSKMFKNTVMISLNNMTVNKTKEKESYLELYHDETLVGINVFDEALYERYSDGFNFPNEENLSILNDYFTDRSFSYSRDDYLRVGEVLDFEAVKGSKNLNLCEVLVADKTYSIVCGASNVEKGMKTIVALDNAILFDGTLIKSGEVLGVFSDGMLCSKKELGLAQSPEEKGIIHLDKNEADLSFYAIDWRKYNV